MKANVITISIPTPSCGKMCNYCISKMTFSVKDDAEQFLFNLPMARKLAERLGVSHCLITAKGEPLDNMYILEDVLTEFQDFPIEIQTNGVKLDELMDCDERERCKILAVSIDHPDQFGYEQFPHEVTNQDWVIRATVIYTNAFKHWQLVDFITHCKKLGIKQLTIRVPSVPKYIQNTPLAYKTAKWIKDNTEKDIQDKIWHELKQLEAIGQAHFIRDLQFGAKIYDVMGIGFTIMEYCIEEQNGDTIRSLIYQSDGHLYTTWSNPGSILF